MSKQAVTGEQVIIRLSSQDGLIPLVLDFDSIDVESKQENDTYRGVGKTVSQNQTKTSGYKIKLTRPKHDHYLKEIMTHIDLHLENGLVAPKFTITEIVTHSYSPTGFIPELEFSDKFNNPFSNSPAFVKASIDAVSNNPITNTANNIISGVGNVVGAIKNVIALSAKPNFVEKTLFKNCTLSNQTYSHKPKEITSEGLVFNCSTIVDLNDSNKYSDEYYYDFFLKNSEMSIRYDKVNSTLNYKSYFSEKSK